MKLTGRQKAFLEQFLDIYGENTQPLHYSVVGERLGVSAITAYDMLRLLEDRGLVISEYVVPGRGAGPGRSTVVFYPTDKATALQAKLAGEDWNREEWEPVRERILQAVRKGSGSSYEGLLNELLNRIPESKSPLTFSAEMISAVILNFHLVREDLTQGALLEALAAPGLPGEVGLGALAGLTIGLALVERANRRVVSTLLAHVRRYQDIVSRLSVPKRRALSDFARELVKAING